MATEINILIGVAGSGKTTWARQHYFPHEIISSDAVRENICGDAASQVANAEVWRVMYAVIRAKLITLQPRIVIDATSVKRRDRRKLLNQIRSSMAEGSKIRGFVVAADINTAIKQDAARGRTVGSQVISQQWRALKSHPPTLEEGFDELFAVDNSAGLAIPDAKPLQ